MTRRPEQIVALQTRVGELSVSTLVVLCDDGSILEYAPRENPPWREFPRVPERGVDLKPVLTPSEPSINGEEFYR